VGPPALPFLANAARGPNTPLRQRALDVTDRINAAKTRAPRLLRVKLNEAPIEDAVRALAIQSGYRLEYAPAAPPQGQPRKTISLDLDGVPFWECLDRLCQAGGLVFSSPDGRTLRLTEGRPIPPGLIAYTGPCRLQIKNTGRRLSLAQPDVPRLEELVIEWEVLAEPSPYPFRIENVQAVEGSFPPFVFRVQHPGGIMRPFAPERPFQGAYGWFPLEPPSPVYRTLPSLRGLLPVEAGVGGRNC
jgi:hypothetical protein